MSAANSDSSGAIALDDDVFERLALVSTATISTQLFARGITNAFMHGLKPLNREHARFAGEAVTLRYIPARADIDTLDVFDDYDHPQRAAIESVGPRQVLVMDCRGQLRAASAGSILVTRMMRRGASALVTDGTLRDTGPIAELGYPVFCAGAAATTNLALHHAVDIQVPIGCAEVPVYPGDVLVGDLDGVVCIPRHLAAEVARDAVEQERLEEFISAQIDGGAPLRGVYPPDERTLARYRAAVEAAASGDGVPASLDGDGSGIVPSE